MKNVDAHTTRNAAYAFILIFALTEAGLFFFKVEQGNVDMLKEMVSTLRDAILFLVGFLFGSSMGSRQKDKSSIDPEAGPVHTKQVETTKVETETRQEAKP